MTEQSPEARLDALISRIAESTHKIQHEKEVPDLSDLEQQAARICKDIETLPPEQAKALESDLLRMISSLENLSAALEDLQQELTAQMPDKPTE